MNIDKYLSKLACEKKGFTLVEILIAMAIFVVLVSVVVATFGFSSNLQTRNLSIRESSQNSRYIVESIARDVRLADSFEITEDDTKITLYRQDSLIEYKLDRESNSIVYSDELQENNNLLSEDIIMGEDSYFKGVGDDQDNVQSYVKIKISFKSNPENVGKKIQHYDQTIETIISTRAHNKGYDIGKITIE
jgi:prepilin-type N-terminal cleavage/methylation domain-containing protein